MFPHRWLARPNLKIGLVKMSDLFSGHTPKSEPVECLGQTFPSEQARREHFLTLLADKLKDPIFRKIEGFHLITPHVPILG